MINEFKEGRASGKCAKLEGYFLLTPNARQLVSLNKDMAQIRGDIKDKEQEQRNFQFVSCFRGSQNHFRALLLNLVSSRLPWSFPPAQLKQALKH